MLVSADDAVGRADRGGHIVADDVAKVVAVGDRDIGRAVGLTEDAADALRERLRPVVVLHLAGVVAVVDRQSQSVAGMRAADDAAGASIPGVVAARIHMAAVGAVLHGHRVAVGLADDAAGSSAETLDLAAVGAVADDGVVCRDADDAAEAIGRIPEDGIVTDEVATAVAVFDRGISFGFAGNGSHAGGQRVHSAACDREILDRGALAYAEESLIVIRAVVDRILAGGARLDIKAADGVALPVERAAVIRILGRIGIVVADRLPGDG